MTKKTRLAAGRQNKHTEVLSPRHLRQLDAPAVHDEVPDAAHQARTGGGRPHLGRVGGGVGRQTSEVEGRAQHQRGSRPFTTTIIALSKIAAKTLHWTDLFCCFDAINVPLSASPGHSATFHSDRKCSKRNLSCGRFDYLSLNFPKTQFLTDLEQ